MYFKIIRGQQFKLEAKFLWKTGIINSFFRICISNIFHPYSHNGTPKFFLAIHYCSQECENIGYYISSIFKETLSFIGKSLGANYRGSIKWQRCFYSLFSHIPEEKTTYCPYHTKFLTQNWETPTALPVWPHYHFLNHSLGQSRHKCWMVNHYKSSCWHLKNLSYWSKEPTKVLVSHLLHFLNVDINFSHI